MRRFFLKSDPVRREWENILISNVQDMMPECHARKERGRIWLEGEVDPAKLKHIFGIVSFSECVSCTLEDLNSSVLKFCNGKEMKKTKSFAVRLKRVGNHNFTSQTKAAELGSLIVESYPHLTVDLDHPEMEIFVEIRDKDCYLFDNISQGAGGIPPGVEGTLVALFSGGIDSPVAAWMMMKRGCTIIPLYVDISPFFDETALERAHKVVESLRPYQPDIRLRVVQDSYLHRAKEFMERKGLEKYTCLLCKRRMYRIAEAFAREEGAKGIVTGESIGQVASQTLDNMYVLNDASTMPFYRPLIGFDKQEIVDIARKIGSYHPSILPAGSCRAVPKKPSTKAKLKIILELERSLSSETEYGGGMTIRDLSDIDWDLLKKLAPECNDLICAGSGFAYRSILPPVANHYAADVHDFRQRLERLDDSEVRYLVGLILDGEESLGCIPPEYVEVALSFITDRTSSVISARILHRYEETAECHARM